MSAWWMEDPDREPPEWSPLVRCIKCGDAFPANELHLDCTTDEWSCRNWPECQGNGDDIRLAEDEDLADGGGEPC